MKRVNVIQTFDGKQFKDQKEATKYLNDEFSRLMHRAFQGLTSNHQRSYMSMTSFINENLDLFVLLKTVKDDLKLDDE